MARFPLALAGLLALALAPAARAAAPVQPYGTNDYRGFRDVLPPGTSGFDNAVELGAFLATGARPSHNADQRDMYGNLVYAAPNLQPQDISKYYKDSTFGVRPTDIERTYSPRADVTIVRDNSFGVPHVYGSTRPGLMFGVGYATAEDRLFFIDVLRHLGRSELTAFAGGAPGNRAFDQQQWNVAPYTEADLNRQIALGRQYGPEGEQIYQDAVDYIAGINAYIDQAKLDPLLMPGEYAAVGRPLGPDPFQVSDIVAIASLVGGIFGRGGGNELNWTLTRQALQAQLGGVKGNAAFLDFRDPSDPEAPTTAAGRFPYRVIPKHARRGSIAIPDRGSVRPADPSQTNGAPPGAGGVGGPPAPSAKPRFTRGLVALPTSDSNALLVAARHSASGHPLAVFGPQVAYFAPEIVMEEDIHGPGIDAAGAAFPGVNLYVELGHGRDYAWSATSAGQDITDTYALKLCDPASITSMNYMFEGRCLPIETLERVNRWTPNLADSTPAGSEDLKAYRTELGLVAARATIKGQPVIFTRLRSTYSHEIDSALGFADFNDPDKMLGPRAFMRAADKIGYTFNWFYADDEHIAYFNSGLNPVRPRGTNPLFPVWGKRKLLWNGDTPISQHPQAIDQDFLTSWNNKQAPGYNAPDSDTPYTSIYRSQSLDDRIRAGIAGGRKLTLAGLINAMEDAGTVDLRGARVLPWVLRVVDRSNDPRLQHALDLLRSWVAAGAHRRDLNHDGSYDNTDALRIMDAWWPLLVKAQFEPVLGAKGLASVESVDEIDNPPNNGGDHLGSAYDVGFYGTVQKDLRAVLGRRVRGRLSRVYCGRGSRRRCRADLLASLSAAIAEPATKVYPADGVCAAGDQMCFDSIVFRALGAMTQPRLPWVNRPTFQQADEIQGHGPR